MKIYQSIFIILLLCALYALNGCRITETYQRPKNLPIREQYRFPAGMDSLADDTLSVISTSWKEYYKDPYLQELMDTAILSNSDLRIAYLRMEESYAYYNRNKKIFYPTAAAYITAEVGRTDVGEKPVQDYILGVATTWEADIWGKLKSSKKASLARLLNEDATYKAIMTGLIADVSQLYFRLVILDAKLEIVNKTIQNNEMYLDKLLRMNNVITNDELPTPELPITISSIAIEQARAELFTAKSYLPLIRADIFVTENSLNLLLGRNKGKIIRSDAHHEITSYGLPEWMGTGIPAQMLSNRPDVMAAEYGLREAHELYNVASAALYPRLQLTGSIELEGNSLRNWFDLPNSFLWDILGGITQPIFQRGELQTEKRVRKLQKEQSLVNFRKQILIAQNEVSNTLMRHNMEMERATLINQQYISLENAFKHSLHLLPEGKTSYLDVLAAQRQLFNAEMQLYDSALEVLNQKVEFYRAIGGGWK